MWVRALRGLDLPDVGSAERDGVQRRGRHRDDSSALRREFEGFVSEVEPRLRRALVALRGPESGRDATAEALAWSWEHWDQVREMENPAGYLYRVGQSRSRPRRGPSRMAPPPDASGLPEVEPGLDRALSQLTDHQRVAVLLVHGSEWTHGEVAELMAISVSSVRNHLRRGLEHLRAALEVSTDA